MDFIFRKTIFIPATLVLAAALVFAAGLVMAAGNALTGDQEVPPVNTTAAGISTITVGDDGAITGVVTTAGMAATMAHIHLGAPGKNGPAILSLMQTSESEWSVPAGTRLSEDQVREFHAGNLYINVHSSTYKDGEIRTQLRR